MKLTAEQTAYLMVVVDTWRQSVESGMLKQDTGWCDGVFEKLRSGEIEFCKELLDLVELDADVLVEFASGIVDNEKWNAQLEVANGILEKFYGDNWDRLR